MDGIQHILHIPICNYMCWYGGSSMPCYRVGACNDCRTMKIFIRWHGHTRRNNPLFIGARVCVQTSSQFRWWYGGLLDEQAVSHPTHRKLFWRFWLRSQLLGGICFGAICFSRGSRDKRNTKNVFSVWGRGQRIIDSGTNWPRDS